jgi:hypothetical protein
VAADSFILWWRKRLGSWWLEKQTLLQLAVIPVSYALVHCFLPSLSFVSSFPPLPSSLPSFRPSVRPPARPSVLLSFRPSVCPSVLFNPVAAR